MLTSRGFPRTARQETLVGLLSPSIMMSIPKFYTGGSVISLAMLVPIPRRRTLVRLLSLQPQGFDNPLTTR